MTSSPTTNRLIHETSPYLRQHAHNPVNWYPWGPEALELARSQDKPILLSIGYSACHWCHVMAHECFENTGIAAIQNAHFINIKLDREERPDLDEIYMNAVQLMTGRGGWPLNVFLTPDLKPFFGGTYFPPEPRHGMISWPDLLERLAEHYQKMRIELMTGQEELFRHMKSLAQPAPTATAELDDQPLTVYVGEMRRAFDPQWGGFGPAPKFPHATDLDLLLHLYGRQRDASLKNMAVLTLERMARGGMYDQLGGGFHRYSTDAQWLIPHFEKMLYDNALLIRSYLEAFRHTANAYFRDIMSETVAYVRREMTDATGGFYSAQDADSEGEEGRGFVWRREELDAILGSEDAAVFAEFYGVTPAGNFENGTSALWIENDITLISQKTRKSVEEIAAILENGRKKMLAAREKRIRPGRDEKILASWNGLMISALSRCGFYASIPQALDAALRARDFLFSNLVIGDGEDASLHRVFARNSEGKAVVKIPGFLEDHAYLIMGLIDLFVATGDISCLSDAVRLQRITDRRFFDEETFAYCFTPVGQDDVLVRTRSIFDGATPSAQGVSVMNLLRLSAITGITSWHKRARRLLEKNSAQMKTAPRACAQMLSVLEFFLHPPSECVIVGSPLDPLTRELVECVRTAPEEPLLIRLDPAQKNIWSQFPALAPKGEDAGPISYLCRQGACLAPARTPHELRAGLTSLYAMPSAS